MRWKALLNPTCILYLVLVIVRGSTASSAGPAEELYEEDEEDEFEEDAEEETAEGECVEDGAGGAADLTAYESTEYKVWMATCCLRSSRAGAHREERPRADS